MKFSKKKLGAAIVGLAIAGAASAQLIYGNTFPFWNVTGPLTVGGDTTLAGNLSVAGNTTFTGSTQIQAVDGTTAAPAYSFASDSDTGLIRPSSGAIDVVSNATTFLRLNGNVVLAATGCNQWGSSGIGSVDTQLCREGVGVVVQKGAAAGTAQVNKVSKTYTSASNYLASAVSGDGVARVGAGASYAGTTVSSCGTSGSVVGNDYAMQVTVGTGGAATTCAVTFGAAFTNAPVCIAQNNTDRVAYSMVTTTGGYTITATAAFTAGSIFHVLCNGK